MTVAVRVDACGPSLSDRVADDKELAVELLTLAGSTAVKLNHRDRAYTAVGEEEGNSVLALACVKRGGEYLSAGICDLSAVFAVNIKLVTAARSRFECEGGGVGGEVEADTGRACSIVAHTRAFRSVCFHLLVGSLVEMNCAVLDLDVGRANRDLDYLVECEPSASECLGDVALVLSHSVLKTSQCF